MTDTVLIVGGGPAGMMAAAVAAKRGKRAVIIEKNRDLGRKLLITGKGRCNITNDCDISEFIENVPVNGNFLYSAFYSFTNRDLVNLLNKAGLETKVERGGRVFPVSDRAADVLLCLKRILKHYGVKTVCAAVTDIRTDGDGKRVILSGNRAVKCDSVIIATGGVSYPKTGSTGDGYRFAKKMGHTIVTPKGSLVPMELDSKYCSALMGLSLRNAALTVFEDGREIYSDFGEMLFTHYGASGPIILSASSHMRDFGRHKYKIKIDLKSALDEQTLDKRILRDFEANKNKAYINSLDALLPKKLIPVIAELSGIDAHKQVNSISKAERHSLLSCLKSLEFDVRRLRSVTDAIVTSGGVSVKEINPKTMESKIEKGIFFAGEVIDVDAYTGGFNLQIAFSTGYLAGMNV